MTSINNEEPIVGEEDSSDLSLELDSTPIVNWKIVGQSNIPTPRFDNSLVHYNNFIYSFGGSENSPNSGGFQSFVKLDLSNFSWQTLGCPINKTRLLHTSVVHGDCMYVFGGGIYEDVRTAFYSSATTKVFKTINELWKFEFLLNQWTQIFPEPIASTSITTIADDIPEPRDGHCSVIVGDDIYILGGSQTINTVGSSTTVHSMFFTNCKIFNITNGTWRTISAPSLGRLGSAVFYKHLDGTQCIYFFGGYGMSGTPSNDLWKYDVKEEKWSLIDIIKKQKQQQLQQSSTSENTPTTTTTTTTTTTSKTTIIIPESRYGHSANVFQDKMLVYGGYSKKKGFLRDFYSFDFDKEEWKQIHTEGPPKRRRHSTVLIDNYSESGKPKLFLFGGTYQSCIYNDLWEYSFPNPVQIPSDNLVEDFSLLFRNANKYFSDVSFILNCSTTATTKEIHAHRNILSVRSHYFNSLFTSGLKESFEKQIQINERHEDFKLLIEFLYSGKEDLVALENCIGVLYLADLYCVPRLKTICEAKATEGIDCESVIEIFKEADNFKLVKLRKLCLNFIARNHKELVKSGSLNQLSPSVLIEVMDYLSNNNNNTCSTPSPK